MPVLADIFSAGNTIKRRMKDFAADPRAFLETEVNYRNQKAGEFNTLQDLATQGDINKMRGLPVTQEQQAAELRLRDIVAGAYNPVGMTSRSPVDYKEFVKLAESGQIRMAKNKEQELNDLLSGKAKFAEVLMTTAKPEIKELVNQLKGQGYQLTTKRQGPDTMTYIYKNEEDVRPIFEAKNPAEYGKAYGYSDADIARFYMERGLGHQKYLKDIGTPKQMTKKPVDPNQPVKTYESTDGYKFYEMPDGKIVDNLNPDNVDMSWGTKKEFLSDMEGTVAEIGDVIGKRRSNLESYGKPDQKSLLKDISQDFENDPITKIYKARKKQIESKERKAKISLVKDDFESDPLMQFLDPNR